MSDAYQLGVSAYENGDDILLCPYNRLDEQSDEWQHGWMDAYIEDK